MISVKVTLQLTEEQVQALDDAASWEDVSRSGLATRAVLEWLEEQGYNVLED